MNSFSWDKFNDVPLVAILRGFNHSEAIKIAKSCLKAGFKNIEVTMNSPEAAKSIESLLKEFGDEMNVGAGTVCNTEELKVAANCGAQFIITPILEPGVITSCKKSGLPIFPGAFTPTEIYHAWQLGADIVKVFPATTLSPTYFRDIKGPLPDIKLMPTGGVGLENLGEFFKAGATAASIGSQLLDKSRIGKQDWDWLEEQAKKFVKCYRAVGVQVV